MRLLALKTKGQVLPFIHSSMVKAFRSLGMEVVECPVPEQRNDHSAFIETAERCQAVFVLDAGIDPLFISHLKEFQEKIEIPWAVWFVDDPEAFGFPQICLSEWTLVFCWDLEISRRIAWGGGPLIHLPLAVDPEVFYPEAQRSAPEYPGGVFVGSMAHENEILESMARTTPGLQAEVEEVWAAYRCDFRRSLADLAWHYLAQKARVVLNSIQEDAACRYWIQTCLREVGRKKRQETVGWVIGNDGAVFGDEEWQSKAGVLFRGSVPYGDELRGVYNQAGFVLDIRQPQIRSGLSQRVFDAGACSRPLLVEWSPELEEFFDGQVNSFYDRQTLTEAKWRILEDPVASRITADKASRIILASHTYRHRAERIAKELQAIA